MGQPLFSIVIANYNYGRFLGSAIESVLSQSFQDFELIVVDGESTDCSVDVIKKYEARIAWWVSEPDKGQSEAFNKGFAHARGRFLTWLNADDVFLPGALQAVAAEIAKHPNCKWFIGSSVYVNRDLRIVRWFRSHRFSHLRARYAFLTCGGPSSFFAKQLYDAVGGIDETFHFLMDIDLWYKFYCQCHATFRRTVHPVFAYRIHADSKMSGADVVQNEKTLRNRARAQAEYDRISQRYKLPGPLVRRLATILSMSVVDRIASIYLSKKHRNERVVR